MRANISDELLNAINEKIYLELELHVMEKKLLSAEQEGKVGFVNHLNQIILNLHKQHREINDYLKLNNVKVYDVVEIDEYFVEYPYSQKVNGGYKEGTQRYWRSGLKYRLQERINKYFTRR